MKVAGEHEFAASRRQVWDALQDPRLLAAAVPGARRLEAVGEDRYAITVDVGVGSVRGTYEGTFAIAGKEPLEACTVEADASGRPGSVRAVARMRLRDGDGSGAVLAYEADATLTGPLAGVGQRLVGAAARRTTGQFLAALDRAIAAPPEEAAAAAAPGGPEPGRALAPAPRRAGPDPAVVVASALVGAAAALLGVAVGRWTARR